MRRSELLLHGVTGSGKTEVYLAAAEAALDRGRGAIILVPEIGMTPQAVSRFVARFGDRVAVLHSRLRAGERRDEWHRLRDGEARICVGPRSAVFAPIAGLGLIVVDEEHDGSYKQEGDPRYDAREVARRRAAQAGAALVLGSATPRPESWDTLERIELPRRVDGRALPAVEVLDMRGRDGRAGPLHERTRDALAEVGERGGKAIVLINRRGWAPHLCCRGCGWVAECPECDVSLVVHAAGEDLRCHHCGHAQPLPAACPECGSVTLARAGAGSQRIEAEIAAAAGGLAVFRLDADSAAGADGHLEILAALRARRRRGAGRHPDGRQGPRLPRGRARGRHRRRLDPALPGFPRRGADLRPGRPARRAQRSRRAQRAGARADAGARGAPPFATRRVTTPPAFSRGELARREELGYPPFAHLIRIELAGADGARAQAAAERLRRGVGCRAARRRHRAGAGAALSASRARAAPAPGQGARAGRGGRRGPRADPRRGGGAAPARAPGRGRRRRLLAPGAYP